MIIVIIVDSSLKLKAGRAMSRSLFETSFYLYTDRVHPCQQFRACTHRISVTSIA